MKKLFRDLNVKSNCQRLVALFIVIILVSSGMAALISSDFGRTKIEAVHLDVRGGVLEGDLYYPAGVSDKDSLPAVIVMHGGAVNKGVMKGFAEELSRRGFVVFNVNAYGVGLSEQPPGDEAGQGRDEFNVFAASPQGMYDALEYIHSLAFVDKTRIGLFGHSLGSTRASVTALLDCSRYTWNDTMINVLYDTFGQKFAEEDITKDADTLAQSRLSQEELAYYYHIKSEQEDYYNSRVNAVLLAGTDAALVHTIEEVKIADYMVPRNLQVNIGVVNGTYDVGKEVLKSEAVINSWYVPEGATKENWYSLDDIGGTSEVLGEILSISILNNEKLSQAISNRSTRICMLNDETHSKNFFSKETTADVVKYFEQTLNYNRGNLTDGQADILDSRNIVFMWRAFFNFIAMLAALAMIFPMLELLLQTKFFAACKVPEAAIEAPYKKGRYILSSIATVAVGFFAIYRANNKGVGTVMPSKFFPLTLLQGVTILFLLIIAAGAIVIFVLNMFMERKESGTTGIKRLNLGIGIINVLKSILIAFILTAGVYLSLVVIRDLFQQDYRFWVSMLSELKTEYWLIVLRYCLILFPLYLIIGAAINQCVRNDISQGKDTLITVVINTAGVSLCCLVNFLMFTFAFDGTQLAAFTPSYQMLFFVPVTVYITRKMYHMTKSIWTGAAFNALLISWSMVAAQGVVNTYYGQGFLSILFGV